MLYFFPAKITLNNKGTHQNLRLSKNDVKFLNKMYPGSPQDPDTFLKKAYGIVSPLPYIKIVENQNYNSILLFLALTALAYFIYTYYKKNEKNEEEMLMRKTFRPDVRF